tara:strand:- start:347 stop:685 length:339 start_codon:yes stop_codon:yes gene_type:complete
MVNNLTISNAAAAELVRQSAFGGTPGEMFIELMPDGFGEGWLFIRIQPGKKAGTPIARADGVTLFAPEDQICYLGGLHLHYYGDLGGGGFLISTPEGAERSSCGSGFKFAST